MTQDSSLPYQSHPPSAALKEFLDPLSPGVYIDCGRARLHGLDDALLREAESRGRQIGDDAFQLVATDLGLIFCRASISFAIAARWDELSVSGPSGNDPVRLPIVWPIHGQLAFTLSRRLASNIFRHWVQVRADQNRAAAERSTIELDGDGVSSTLEDRANEVINLDTVELDISDLMILRQSVAETSEKTVATSQKANGATVSSVLLGEPSDWVIDAAPEVTEQGSDEVTEHGSQKVTEQGSQKVTEQGSDEVTEQGSDEVTDLAVPVVPVVPVDPAVPVVPVVPVDPAVPVVPVVPVDLAVPVVPVVPMDLAVPAQPTVETRSLSENPVSEPVPHVLSSSSESPTPEPVEEAAVAEGPVMAKPSQGSSVRLFKVDSGEAIMASGPFQRLRSGEASWVGSPMSLAAMVAILSGLVLAITIAVTTYRSVAATESSASNAVVGTSTIDNRRFAPVNSGADEGDVVVQQELAGPSTSQPESSKADTESITSTSRVEPRLCNSNYSGCVPDVTDVDCPNDGDGPVYATEPVLVMGEDVYELDTDGDGETCESDQPRSSDVAAGSEGLP